MRSIPKFVRNFSLVLFSNGVGLVLSVVMSVVLPLIFDDDVTSYGYIQLYLLYISYYYLFDLGLCNGIYLKEGGKNYSELNCDVYSAQFIILVISQIAVGILIYCYSLLFVANINKQFLLAIVSINIVVMQLKTLLTSIFQATNRIKEYSITVMICKLLNTLSITAALLLGIRNYRTIVILFTGGEVVSLVYAIVKGQRVIFCKPATFHVVGKEIKENIKVGLSLLISGVSAMLITGAARLAIERQWNIEVFAKISLTLSISNMFMLFINAVSVVLYPEMRRMTSDRYIPMYNKMRLLLMVLMLGALIFCYPMQMLIANILPQYRESLTYMAVLLPLCVYSGKMSMLIQTYMKVLRLEKEMMKVNVVSLVISILLTMITVFAIKNITLAVFSVLISQMFRTVLAELVLSRHTNINPIKDITIELAISGIFIISNWIIGGLSGMLLYCICYISYLLAIKAEIATYVFSKRVSKKINEK
jgi:O-antigen/teichoic acid export membrane protein